MVSSTNSIGRTRKSPGILRGSGGLVVVICKMSMRYIKCVHILRQCCLPHLTNHSMKPPYQNFLLLHTQTDHVLGIGGNCACTPSASTVVFPSACGRILRCVDCVTIFVHKYRISKCNTHTKYVVIAYCAEHISTYGRIPGRQGWSGSDCAARRRACAASGH